MSSGRICHRGSPSLSKVSLVPLSGNSQHRTIPWGPGFSVDVEAGSTSRSLVHLSEFVQRQRSENRIVYRRASLLHEMSRHSTIEDPNRRWRALGQSVLCGWLYLLTVSSREQSGTSAVCLRADAEWNPTVY